MERLRRCREKKKGHGPQEKKRHPKSDFFSREKHPGTMGTSLVTFGKKKHGAEYYAKVK